MADEIANTEASAAIPEVWRRKALMARYAKSKVYSRVLHADDEVRQMGDIINIRTLPSVTVNDVTATTGAVTNQALTYGTATITVDKWKEATIDVVDKANIQALTDLLDEFSSQFGAAIAAQQDADIFGLHGSLTSNVVGSTTAGEEEQLNADLLLAAMQKLDDRDVPEEDRTWYFAPVARTMLLKHDKFVLADALGMEKGLQLKGPKALGELFGNPLYISTKVVTSGALRKNMLLHKEAIGAATQKNFKIEKLARVRKSTPISGDVLYGVAALRETHGVIINTSSSAT